MRRRDYYAPSQKRRRKEPILLPDWDIKKERKNTTPPSTRKEVKHSSCECAWTFHPKDPQLVLRSELPPALHKRGVRRSGGFLKGNVVRCRLLNLPTRVYERRARFPTLLHITTQPAVSARRLPAPFPPAPPSSSSAWTCWASLARRRRRRNPAPAAPTSSLACM